MKTKEFKENETQSSLSLSEKTYTPDLIDCAVKSEATASPHSPVPLESANLAGKNSKTNNCPCVKVSDLSPHPAIKNLYKKDERVLESLIARMTATGNKGVPAIQTVMDESGKMNIVDGCTRVFAAIKAGIKELPFQIIDPADDCNILMDAVEIQHKKRENNSRTIVSSVKGLLPYASEIAKSRQGKRTSYQDGEEVGKGTNGIISAITGVGTTTVGKVKKVLQFDDLINKIMTDDNFTINLAYKEAKARENGMGGQGRKVAMQGTEPADGDNAKTNEATEAKAPTAKPATSANTAQKSVVEKTSLSVGPDDSPVDSRQKEIESIAQALESFNPEEVWECIKRLSHHVIDFLGKQINETQSKSEEAKQNA
jgi:hypothetical protein